MPLCWRNSRDPGSGQTIERLGIVASSGSSRFHGAGFGERVQSGLKTTCGSLRLAAQQSRCAPLSLGCRRAAAPCPDASTGRDRMIPAKPTFSLKPPASGSRNPQSGSPSRSCFRLRSRPEGGSRDQPEREPHRLIDGPRAVAAAHFGDFQHIELPPFRRATRHTRQRSVPVPR